MATALEKPEKGQDVRGLWRYVDLMVKRTNALLNMSGTFQSSIFHGLGNLRVIGAMAELRITTSGGDPEGDSQINKKRTNVAMASSKSPSEYGEAVQWVAVVADDATGTITFFVDGGGFGPPVTVVSGVATSQLISQLSPGAHTITAHYSGSWLYMDAWGTFTQIVNALNPPTMSVIAQPNPATKGIDYVKFITNLNFSNPIPPAPRPGGVVRFFIDGSNFMDKGIYQIDTQVWRADTADNAVNWIPFGDHTILAYYLGDNHYDTANATTILHVKMGSSMDIDANPNPVEVNQNFDIDITVHGSGGAGIPTGQIALWKNGGGGWVYDLDVNGQVLLGDVAPSTEQDITYDAHYYGSSRYTPCDAPQLVVSVVPHNEFPYGLAIVPSSVIGTTGIVTFATYNLDQTHNNYNGDLDIYATGYQGSSGGQQLVFFQLQNNTPLWLDPNIFQKVGTLTFVGGYVNSVVLQIAGIAIESTYALTNFKAVKDANQTTWAQVNWQVN